MSTVHAIVPARIPTARRRVAANPRDVWSYGSERVYTSRPASFPIAVDASALDPAAAALLPVLREPGLRLFGETAAGERGNVLVPVCQIGTDRPVAGWLNQIVADWRDGSRYLPPLVSITAVWGWGERVEIEL